MVDKEARDLSSELEKKDQEIEMACDENHAPFLRHFASPNLPITNVYIRIMADYSTLNY